MAGLKQSGNLFAKGFDALDKKVISASTEAKEKAIDSAYGAMDNIVDGYNKLDKKVIKVSSVVKAKTINSVKTTYSESKQYLKDVQETQRANTEKRQTEAAQKNIEGLKQKLAKAQKDLKFKTAHAQTLKNTSNF